MSPLSWNLLSQVYDEVRNFQKDALAKKAGPENYL